MLYGLTGNPTKDQLWPRLAGLIGWLDARDLPYRLHAPIAEGLAARGLPDRRARADATNDALAAACDVVLSFGGDGTMLRTAHTTGLNGTPLLGVNIGRLGFLADIEAGAVTDAVEAMEAGRYRIEQRIALEAHLGGPPAPDAAPDWALNECVLDRSGAGGLIQVEVQVDGRPLNTYWADGLIVATPTGSSAYSLSAGGPLIAPGTGALVVTPLAPHTLTVRPIVLPASVTLTARVHANGHPYVFSADGRTRTFDTGGLTVRIEQAEHTVNLVKLDGRDYFQTLRSKLMWGVRHPALQHPDADDPTRETGS